jgi:hypothetical protein
LARKTTQEQVVVFNRSWWRPAVHRLTWIDADFGNFFGGNTQENDIVALVFPGYSTVRRSEAEVAHLKDEVFALGISLLPVFEDVPSRAEVECSVQRKDKAAAVV